jgi:hypothetical protein
MDVSMDLWYILYELSNVKKENTLLKLENHEKVSRIGLMNLNKNMEVKL